MTSPCEYSGCHEVCTGCAEIIRTGDLAAPLSDDRPDRLLCVACWWSLACDLPLPAWERHDRRPRQDH